MLISAVNRLLITIFSVTISTVFAFCVAYGVLLFGNNRTVELPANDELGSALEAGIVWLVENKEKVLQHNNHVLWWLVQQAAEKTGDPRLEDLFAKYFDRYMGTTGTSFWRPLFKPGSWVPVRFDQIQDLLYYNWHMIYAITCDADLGNIPQIAEQNDPEYCSRYLLKPACATHQLMGLRFMQLSECGDQDQLAESITHVSDTIHRQLVWDVRVVDVYIQRVLMLVETGHMELVKPVWVSNILDAQLEDGGWANKQPLLEVSDNLYLGFTGRGIATFHKQKGDFHATAQGVYLLSLLAKH